MLYPKLDVLKKAVNSKYMLVSLASKRARELFENPEDGKLDEYVSHKEVGRALEEIAAEKINVLKK
ncbi:MULTISPECIES: DNA-directed RNA polymerase subunit omega [unclassified Gemella]|uniref:DNA-directed RNA polymerase subunit omega n=1 Tax=unclassified Gemella TaxID=2624949 RepID=UPI0010746EE2|nr:MULTISPECIES: DNA-directed RNA polymerase subunit omega [unclassified Gemella]MBF0710240.1 DNA-directed RNA polymerase subunit omega [Gemella sp. GL1.1]MBF0746332.1 DNA-directed RNA polymerase subunit omega [Gemella sp. 19428wG2_WT2a]NYS27584.1 DNA-directed RNA polymerase subunit omega [Gemella sp. GL1]TFU60608.1 DNA-directed RNA polymerase subunit omega [Gemella sp. WT2a]